MRKVLVFLGVFMVCGAMAATSRPTSGKASKYIDPETYSYMYPYLSNKMRTELNPGVTVSQVNNPVDVYVHTKQMGEARRVVPRTRRATNTARAAQNTSTNRRVVARRSGVSAVARSATTTSGARRVVPRTTARSGRNENTVAARNAEKLANVDTSVSATRCMADYTNCMNGYCERENTAYNRCFCSAKLSQIDAQYQPAIENLINQIIVLQSGVDFNEEEFNEYWMNAIGNYVGENNWENIDNALNINWATSENRMRGQQAFVTGHEYCIQHLHACSYMASNLRDSYRSNISRDCKNYEMTLERIKNAAESAVSQYSE